MKRIVFTTAFGHPKFAQFALGLGRSLRLIGDQNRRVVLTDLPNYPWEKSFDEVIHCPVPQDEVWWSKFYALEHTDADQILFIDGDSLAFKRIDPIFSCFDGQPFGVQGVYRNTGTWYDAPLSGVCTKLGVDAIPKFNGGLLYYERGAQLDELINASRECGEASKSMGFRLSRGVPADEISLALAMAKTGIGKLADDRLNFHNSGVGLIGKLRMDVLQAECRFICRRYDVQYVEPYIFHAHFYSKFLIYWRQLAKLEKLEKYEAEHGFGYMSPAHKLRRSIERRILKLRGKL